MPKVTSRDGTIIAYDQVGQGPAVILIGGAFNTRSFGPNASLVPLLAEQFTVINYDRRGRGNSSDTLPYSVEREVDDIDALLDVVGGSAHLYGVSSGAALALEAANKLPSKVKSLALFEAPFVVDTSRDPLPSDFAQHLEQLIQKNRRGAAIRYFMTTGVKVPTIFVWMMRLMPSWSQLKQVANTVPYDAYILGNNGLGKPLNALQWSNVDMPTLVMDGGKSPQWVQASMKALANCLRNAKYRTLEGQMHFVSADAVGPVLVDFFQNK